MRRAGARCRAIFAIVLVSASGCSRPRPSATALEAAGDEALAEGERRLALEQPREAAHFFFRALARHRDASSVRGEVASLVALGRLQRREGRNALALEFFSKAMARATDGETRVRAAALCGESLLALGRNEAAVEVLEGVLHRRGKGLERGDERERGTAWLHLARAQRALGRLRRSRAAAEKALALGGAPGSRPFLVEVLVDLGEVEQAFELSQDVTLEWVQKVLLDRHTRVLAYHPGESRSLLWDVTSSRLRVHHLAGTSSLEHLAREARHELANGEEGAARARARLSELLLGPVALTGEDRRLVIVSSGELASVPFAALFPSGSLVPLVSRLEIVRVRSLSSLRLLRARSGRRYERWVAVAADPSYGLLGARREARAISKLGPEGTVAVVEGSEAGTSFVLGNGLGSPRILHLATHGVSGRGLVLSDAILGTAELARAELTAETVVLSACATATDLTDVLLGRGARRVVASHWSVDDEATAELMTRFYAAVFSGASPGAALREAQIALSRRPRFSAPRYWAAFELHGDWAV